MEITSYIFLLFVLGVLIIYYVLPHRAQNYWLLISSYVFYATWSWKFALLLLCSTVFHFLLAKRLGRNGQGRDAFLLLGIGANIVVFFIFKASSFYLHRLITLFDQMNVPLGFRSLEILLPLGLSYYVLENISYLMDIYRGQMRPVTDPINFALYLSYFPKMMAGPIERARTFLPILAHPRFVDNRAISRSIALIFFGLTRKLLVANLLFSYTPWGKLNNDVFIFSKLELFGWLIVYSFGLYNDFAGYTSIVRGVSGLFGIELSPNFDVPYFSKSFKEFWNRWHITLSQWLRDYIFFPLNRRLARYIPIRKAWLIMIISPMVTMFISGIWHKPNWQMLLWGGIHGFYLATERVLTSWKQQRGKIKKKEAVFSVNTVIVFLLIILTWAPFSMGVSPALNLWKQLWYGNIIGLVDNRLIYSLIILIPALYLDWVEYHEAEKFFILQKNDYVQAALLAIIFILILIVTDSGAGKAFVYQGF